MAEQLPKAIDLKPFVPAKDFDLSLAFYQDIGFEMKSNEGGVAFFSFGSQNFLLQDFYQEILAENLVIHKMRSKGHEERRSR